SPALALPLQAGAGATPPARGAAREVPRPRPPQMQPSLARRRGSFVRLRGVASARGASPSRLQIPPPPLHRPGCGAATGPRRIVLAVLLLHANEFVSSERLIDELWGESRPPTPRKAVNVYVSQLREVLTRNGRDPIATGDGGSVTPRSSRRRAAPWLHTRAPVAWLRRTLHEK